MHDDFFFLEKNPAILMDAGICSQLNEVEIPRCENDCEDP